MSSDPKVLDHLEHYATASHSTHIWLFEGNEMVCLTPSTNRFVGWSYVPLKTTWDHTVHFYDRTKELPLCLVPEWPYQVLYPCLSLSHQAGQCVHLRVTEEQVNCRECLELIHS